MTALNEAIKVDHGFNAESHTIRNLIETMLAFNAPTRRQYLQFLTGSPRLPIGGSFLHATNEWYIIYSRQRA